MMQLHPFIIMVLHAFQPCSAKPTFHDTYRSPDFTPKFRQTDMGPRIVSPDTPYVAAAGRHHLYYIDMRFSPEDAAHIKAQVEHAWTMKGDEHHFVDEIEATAEKRNAAGEVVFVFDPPYARVLFADFINRHNPDIKLPEHGPAGERLVSYRPGDEGNQLETREACEACSFGRADNKYAVGNPDSTGISHPLCGKKVDTARFEGETDANYYRRMDKLHWGDKKVRIPGEERSDAHQ
jgi:hypothetical protein